MAATALAQYWSNKWESGALCDVLVHCKEGRHAKQIKCHSFILAPSSPLFEELGEEEENGGDGAKTKRRQAKSGKETTATTGFDKLTLTQGGRENEAAGVTCSVEVDDVTYAEWQAFLHLAYYGTIKREKLEKRLLRGIRDSLLSAVSKLEANKGLKDAAVAYRNTTLETTDDDHQDEMVSNQTPEIPTLHRSNRKPPKKAPHDNQPSPKSHQVTTPENQRSTSKQQTPLKTGSQRSTRRQNQLTLESELESSSKRQREKLLKDNSHHSTPKREASSTRKQRTIREPKRYSPEPTKSPKKAKLTISSIKVEDIIEDTIAATIRPLPSASKRKRKQPLSMELSDTALWSSVKSAIVKFEDTPAHGMIERLSLSFTPARVPTPKVLRSPRDVQDVPSTENDSDEGTQATPDEMKNSTKDGKRNKRKADQSATKPGKDGKTPSQKGSSKSAKGNKRTGEASKSTTSAASPSTSKDATRSKRLQEKLDKRLSECTIIPNPNYALHAATSKGATTGDDDTEANNVPDDPRDLFLRVLPSHGDGEDEKESPDDEDIKNAPQHDPPADDTEDPTSTLTHDVNGEIVTNQGVDKLPTGETFAEISDRETGNETQILTNNGQHISISVIEQLGETEGSEPRQPDISHQEDESVSVEGTIAHIEQNNAGNVNDEPLEPPENEPTDPVQTNKPEPQSITKNVVGYTEEGAEVMYVDPGYIPDSTSVCVYCWRYERACLEAYNYKCFLCIKVIERKHLDEHITTCHADLTPLCGYFTCLGKTDVVLPEEVGIVGKTVRTLIDGQEYKSFACTQCDFTSTVLMTFRVHLTSKHSVRSSVSHYTSRCKGCLHFMSNTGTKDDHEHFCLGKGYPQCIHCGAKFSSPSGLRRHLTVMHPQRPRALDSNVVVSADGTTHVVKPVAARKKQRRQRQHRSSTDDGQRSSTDLAEDSEEDMMKGKVNTAEQHIASQGERKPLHNLLQITNQIEAEGSGDAAVKVMSATPQSVVNNDAVGESESPFVIPTSEIEGLSSEGMALAEQNKASTAQLEDPTVAQLSNPTGNRLQEIEQIQEQIEEVERRVKNAAQLIDTRKAVEGSRADRDAICLYCWKQDALCGPDHKLLLCFLCYETVGSHELDDHTATFHPHIAQGIFTCRAGKLKADSITNAVVARRDENKDGTVRYVCMLCDTFSANMIQVLKKHIKEVHAINTDCYKVLFKCSACPLYFSQATWRENHEYFCRGLGLPKCEICLERFPNPCALRLHRNEAHLGEETTEVRSLLKGGGRGGNKRRRKRTRGADGEEGSSLEDEESDEEETAMEGDENKPVQAKKRKKGGGFGSRINRRRNDKAEATNTTAVDGETEGQRSDRQALCLYCWKSQSLCTEAVTLKCFHCFQPVSWHALDQHAKEEHPHVPFGVYTCQGRRAVKMGRNYGILARKAPDQEQYHCELCTTFVADNPKTLKLHLIEVHEVKNATKQVTAIARCRVCMAFFSNAVAAEDHQYFCKGVELDGLPFCQECQERFASPNAYRRHMKTVHKQIRTTNLDSYAESKSIEPTKELVPFSFKNPCPKENAEFDRADRRSLCVHCWKANRVCNEVELLKCFVCFQTVHAHELDAHALTHPTSNAGLYTCLGIHNGRLANNTEIYGTIGRKISATEAGAADIYECLVCDFNTEILQHFKDHQANKHAVKVSKCNFLPRCRYCFLYFTANSVQEDHEYFCRGADLPYCEECNMRFASPNSWRRHVNDKHSGKYGPKKYFSNSQANRSLLCELCGISFKNRSQMKYHERTRHGGGTGPNNANASYVDRPKFTCSFCGASFLRAHTLNEHINCRHTKAKRYKCKFCERWFLRRSELARHQQLHAKSSMAIKCSMCDFQGFTKFELKRHFFQGHNIGPFKCTCCRAKFTDYEKYEEHKFLKLCPRYGANAAKTPSRRAIDIHPAGHQQLAPEYNTDVSEDAAQDDMQLCTWVKENGEMVQICVPRDVIDGDGQIQEGVQLIELPNGEMQLIRIQGDDNNDLQQLQLSEPTHQTHVGASDIQEGKVQLVQMDDCPVQIKIEKTAAGNERRVTTQKTDAMSNAHIDASTEDTVSGTYDMQVIQTEDGHVQVHPAPPLMVQLESQSESAEQQLHPDPGRVQVQIQPHPIDSAADGGAIQYHVTDSLMVEAPASSVAAQSVETQGSHAEEEDQLDQETVVEPGDTQGVMTDENMTEGGNDLRAAPSAVEGGEESLGEGGKDVKQETLVMKTGASGQSEGGEGLVAEAVSQPNEGEDDGEVMEMSLEAFQQAYGEGALQAVGQEEGKEGGYYVVYL